MVDVSMILLMQKGERTIQTEQGTIKLGEVYFADSLKYNLVCVPKMIKIGVKVVLEEQKAFIVKNESKINLKMVNRLWVLPEI